MKVEVHQHPDGDVFVRGEVGVYHDTPEHFALDFGEVLPALPEGAIERVYTQGVRHAFHDDGNVVDGGPMPWPLGDAIIAALPSLLAKKAARG